MKKLPKILIIPAVGTLREATSKYKDSYDFVFGSYRNLEIHFEKTGIRIYHSGVDIKEFDKVWLSSLWETRDIAYAVSLYLDSVGISHSYSEPATSKITDQMKLALCGIDTPNTWYCTRNNISCYVDSIEKVCKYPMVIKDIFGSRGKYASYISGVYDLVATRISLPADKRYMVQEFIPNDYEWGVLVVNGKIVSAEKSYPKDGEHRNNACNGAREVFVEIDEVPEHIRELVVKSAKALGLSWCRVDILEDKKSGIPYVLEINRFPGITSKSAEVDGASAFLKGFLEL